MVIDDGGREGRGCGWRRRRRGAAHLESSLKKGTS